MTACYCDYDAPSFFRADQVIARKAHLCGECGCAIRPGETYEVASGLWDGRFDRFKTCARCRELRVWLKANTPCFCWYYGNVLDDVHEHLSHVGPDLRIEAPGVLFAAGRKLVAIRRRADADRRVRYETWRSGRSASSAA